MYVRVLLIAISDLALALGIPVEELAADRVEERKEEIKAKLQKGGHLSLTVVCSYLFELLIISQIIGLS